eukprot:2553484-Amphidinium_carterae.1
MGPRATSSSTIVFHSLQFCDWTMACHVVFAAGVATRHQIFPCDLSSLYEKAGTLVSDRSLWMRTPCFGCPEVAKYMK